MIDQRALELKANKIRQLVVEMLIDAGSGHTAGPLDLADIFATLFFAVIKYDPNNPDWEERDRLVLSNGHTVPVLYASMALAGYFPLAELRELRKFGSRLQGHPERVRLPGLETTSGPLGSGLSQAAGMALGLKRDNKKNFVYVVNGDGELQEGNIWEAVMFAGKYRLGNLISIIDRNYIQIDGMTEDVMPLEPLADKYQAFGWQVFEINGHNPAEIYDAIAQAKAVQDKPSVIIARTIPGKGVDFIEFDYHWHGYDPDASHARRDYQLALKKLRSLDGRIKGEHQ
ncbi:transketolase [Candidatus Saccharibacteria bacterium]|nr:transketolase [Candidatus Saccharibacteria bacterium]